MKCTVNPTFTWMQDEVPPPLHQHGGEKPLVLDSCTKQRGGGQVTAAALTGSKPSRGQSQVHSSHLPPPPLLCSFCPWFAPFLPLLSGTAWLWFRLDSLPGTEHRPLSIPCPDNQQCKYCYVARQGLCSMCQEEIELKQHLTVRRWGEKRQRW